MKPSRTLSFRHALPFLILAVVLLLVPAVLANVRVEGAEIAPFYARITRSEVFHDGEWAAIVFYRPPACVPDDFNLLDFFDIPGAFACGPVTVDGFSIWENGLGIDPAPIQSNVHGLGAVPVWFVYWSELEPALGDGVLTIVELEAMPSLLTGSAHTFSEALRPSEAAQVSGITFTAHGGLEDGRAFFVHATGSPGAHQVNIHFR